MATPLSPLRRGRHAAFRYAFADAFSPPAAMHYGFLVASAADTPLIIGQRD